VAITSWKTIPVELSMNTAMLEAPGVPAVVGGVVGALSGRISKSSM
jgi:hypothetical protein